MTINRNMTSEDNAADLEAAFSMALSDALKADKVASSVLEVARRTIEDHRAQRRWESEQAALVAAAVPVATSGATTPAPSRIIAGVDLDKIPFRTKSKGVDVPPKASEAEASDHKPTMTWEQGLNQIPFLTPDH